jgi:hypothetical protein
MRAQHLCPALLALALSSAHVANASAQEAGSEDLAKKLANPISSLISLPFQFNYNGGIGPDGKGSQYYVNIQPVIPFAVNEDWNVISRTILPVISQHDVYRGAGSQFGLGDTTQSFFLSPSQSPNGITWGVGPALLIPTATDDLLGSGKWGAGPTAVGLWQGHGWTIGALVTQIWSFAGDSDRANVNTTSMQPFIAYTTKDAWTFTLNTESSYDWEADEWSVPINLQVSKIVKLGKLPVSLYSGVRYWAASPESGPTGWGLRGGITFLFPAGRA